MHLKDTAMRSNHIIAGFSGLLYCLLALVACTGGSGLATIEQSSGEIGPQEIAGATEIRKFDPASITLRDEDPVSAGCEASAIVKGVYRCALDDSAADPCFSLDGRRLLCHPDPVAGTYEMLVTSEGALPIVPPPPLDEATVFFVELADDMTCAIRTSAEPVIIGGVTASYECDEPYTYILGEGESPFSKDAPVWEAGVYILDPDTGESPSGKIPRGISRVWIP
jgi:hypothetical protein